MTLTRGYKLRAKPGGLEGQCYSNCNLPVNHGINLVSIKPASEENREKPGSPL